MWTDLGFAQVLRRGLVAGLAHAIMVSSAGAASADGPLTLAGSQLEPVTWNALAGWTADDHLAPAPHRLVLRQHAAAWWPIR
jgi:hypothetical protein